MHEAISTMSPAQLSAAHAARELLINNLVHFHWWKIRQEHREDVHPKGRLGVMNAESRVPLLGGKKHHVITGCHRHGQPLHSHFAFAFAFAPDGAEQSRNQGLRPLSITIHESVSLGKKGPAIDSGSIWLPPHRSAVRPGNRTKIEAQDLEETKNKSPSA
jgi:hypothetical protein